MTSAEVVALEEGALEGWPALETRAQGGWLWRFAGGYSKRANAALPLYAPGAPDGRLLGALEAAYRRAGLPPVVKVWGHPDWAALDRQLDQEGYDQVDPSWVLTRPLGAPWPAQVSQVKFRVDEGFSVAWLEGFWKANGVERRHRGPAAAMVARVAQPLVGSAVVDGQTSAWAYVARVGTQAWLFDLVVAPEVRRRGLARALVIRLLEAAAEAGCQQGCLQVLEANAPARRLYHELGFTPAYRYWYRRNDHAQSRPRSDRSPHP